MPQVSAAVLRSTPSSTSASASIRRAAALFFSPLAALRSSEAVRSSRVIDTAAPIDAAPLKGQHRVRVSLIWESPMSHSFGPLVLDLLALHRAADVVRMPDRERHDRQRWIAGGAASELAAIRDEQVLDVVGLAEFVHHAIPRLLAHPVGAH